MLRDCLYWLIAWLSIFHARCKSLHACYAHAYERVRNFLKLAVTGDFERFHYFIFETIYLENGNTFLKNWSIVF